MPKPKPLVCLFAAGLLVSLALVSPSQAAKGDDPAAEIVSIQGVGQFREVEEQPWRSAAMEQDLFQGNFVRTGDYSRMGLLFADRTQIRLNEKTVLQVKQVQPPVPDRGGTILRLNLGRAWTQSRSIPKGLIMETPSATAAIRGTNWEMAVAEDSTSTLTVLSGEVEFYNDYGRVVVGRNEQARAEMGKAPVKTVLVDPRERVQWVTAFEVDPLRHVSLHGGGPEELGKDLRSAGGDTADQRVLRGFILADLGRWREAGEELASALDLQPGNGRGLLGMGFVALRGGDPQTALESFDRAAGALGREDGELLALGRAAARLLSGEFATAREILQSLAADRSRRQPASNLILSDIMIYGGDLEKAMEYVHAGLERFPDSARLYAQLGAINLMTDRALEGRDDVKNALLREPGSVEAWLVLGDIERIEGYGEASRTSYGEAASLKEAEDRAWYGLGIVNTEREEVREGVRNLARALELNPGGAGYQGQMGTLQTFANDFDQARNAFDAALERNPDDYVALTGLGLLELKRGNTEEALDAFLKAEILEPRYARVQMFKAIAYYQMGRVEDSLESLGRASRLDDRDPLPHIVASIIYTDLLRGDEAIDEARVALDLLPYLKSLNQLASDQQGTANLGKSFAFMGLDEWSASYAQESYYPFWAGSHLFLASVGYDGLFTRNSELFQGFLSDPTLFGASPRSQTILPRPGHNLVASMRVTQSEDYGGTSPFLAVSGFGNRRMPLAYFLSAENFDLDFDDLPYDLTTYTAALGASPRHDLGLFLFADLSDLHTEVLEPTALGLYDLEDDLGTDRLDLGLHYKLSPRSNVWFKAGFFGSEDDIEGTIAGSMTTSEVQVDQPELALRHTFMMGEDHEVTWGIEWADRDASSDWYLESSPGAGFFAYFDYGYSEEALDLYLSDRFRVNESLLLQLDLTYVDHERTATYDDYMYLPGSPLLPVSASAEGYTNEGVYPRLGLVYRFTPNRLVRVAYQNWVRPSSFSSLGHVATAGIPLEDRLVMRGGELERLRGQVEWEFTPRTFATAYLDLVEIHNNRFTQTPFTVSELEDLVKLRQRDMGALIRGDLLEFVNTPEYDGGDILTAGLAVNHRLGGGLGLLARYAYTDAENNGVTYEGNAIPYLPEHAAALGATWMSPRGWYAVTRFVYRTERFVDEANASLLEESWDGAVDLFRESVDKRWLFRFSVDEILDENQDTQYTAEASVRF